MINTPARNNLPLRQFGATLYSSNDELGAKLVSLWMISRKRDSLEVLKEFVDRVTMGQAQGVRNGCFGAEVKFELNNQSKVRVLT